ncbi:hypothetical protein OAD36_03695 [Gammaproteobacteria bacterium]|nr:hypothetical protein [Gammaproteobacteria bacterium]
MKFIKGEAYSRDDIHQLYFQKPLPKKGTGNWLTGYVRVEDELVVFVNINTAGKTGHDFDNQYDPNINRLTWFGKPKTHSQQKLISLIILKEIKLHFFVRFDSNQKYFNYLGTGFVIDYEDGAVINLPNRKKSFAIKLMIQLQSKNKKAYDLIKEDISSIPSQAQDTSKILKLNKASSNTIIVRAPDIEEFEGLNQPLEILGLSMPLQKMLLKHKFIYIKDLFLLDQPKRLTPEILSELSEAKDLIIQSKGLKIANFQELISAFVHNLKTGLKGRLSGELTLQQAGDLDGLTRERIRQLEKKVMLQILKIKHLITVQLNNIEPPRNEPLFLWKLEFYNSFFFGISLLIKTASSSYLDLFLSADSNFEFEVFNGRHILYKRGKPSFKECIEEIKNLGIEDSFSDYLSLSLGRSDLQKLLERKFLEEAPKSQMGKVGYALKKILPTANKLMSMSEIQKLLKDHHGLSVQQNMLGNVCKRKFPNFFQFGKSKWGIEENFRKLDDREAEIFANLAWAYLQINQGTMILASIIFDNLDIAKHPLFFEKELNSYDLSWALNKFAGKFPQLQEYGRQYWSYGDASNGKSTKISDIILSLLQEAGEPMPTSKIIEFIKSKRSISKTFQLRSSISMGDIVSTKPGFWGLKRRDISINESEEATLLNNIQSYFKNSGPVIDAKILNQIIQSIPLKKSLSMYQVSRFLLSHVSSNPTLGPYFQIKFHRSDINLFYIVDFKSNIDPNELSF